MRTSFAALVLLSSLWLAAPAARAEPCATGTRLLWLLSDDGHLWTLHPHLLAFSDEGAPACRVAKDSRPTALAVTAEGQLWVAYSGGELGRVDPSSRECRVSKATVPGIRSLATEPVQDAGALVAVDAHSMARLEPATGVLATPVSLSGDGPLAWGADGGLWQLSPGVVPELWRLSSDGQIHKRTALTELRGASYAHALATVGDTPWLVVEHDGASRFWRFDPDTDGLQLQPGTPRKTFIAASSVPSCADVVEAACGLDANITSPEEGAVLAGWKPFDVSLDAAAPRVKVDGPGLSRLVPVQEQKGKWMARLSLPSTDRIAQFTLRPADEEGRGCGPAVTVTRGRLALSATLTLPDDCTTDAACQVEATLSRTGVDEVARAFLDSSRASAQALVAGRRAPLTKDDDGVWRGALSQLPAGNHELVVRFSSVGLVVERATHLRVRAPVSLSTKDSITLGEVVAGTPWRDTCVSVPVNTSGLDAARLRVSAKVPGDCVGQLMTTLNGRPLPLSEGVELAARPSMHLPVCLQVAACAGAETQRAELLFAPADEGHANVRATASVEWSTSDPSWWACHEALVGRVGFLLLFGLVFAGFLAPRRFAATSAVRTAPSRGELAEASPRKLRALKGGRRGWYRDARCGLDHQGVAVARGREAVVYIESASAQARLVAGTVPLRVFNPKTHRLDPIESAAVEPGVVYEAGGLWLTFE